MLINELIDKLQKMSEKYGNVPVYLWDFTDVNQEYKFDGNTWVDWEHAGSEKNRILLRIEPT